MGNNHKFGATYQERIDNRYRAGYSIADIAKRAGKPAETIRADLRAAGHPVPESTTCAAHSINPMWDMPADRFKQAMFKRQQRGAREARRAFQLEAQ